MGIAATDGPLTHRDERLATTAARAPDVELSVVLPAHDEGDSLPPLLDEIRTALDGVTSYEVVVVDDGSLDDTIERLRDARRLDPRVRILRHRTCVGQSAALRTGVRAARGPWIATLDADGQNDPADLPRLFALARADGAAPGARLIAGHRRTRRDGLSKRLASRVANGIRQRFLGDRTPDTGCGLKVFGRDAFLTLPYFDHLHRFLPVLFQDIGTTVASVEVHHRPRAAGRSKYGTIDRALAGVVDLLGVLWLQRRSSRPDVHELP